MFKRKKKRIPNTIEQYRDWDKDWSFLDYVLTTKKREYIEIRLNVEKSKSTEDTNVPNVLDETTIYNTTSEIVTATLRAISDDYKTALIDKYFSSPDMFLDYLTRFIYLELVLFSKTANKEMLLENKMLSNYNLKQIMDM